MRFNARHLSVSTFGLGLMVIGWQHRRITRSHWGRVSSRRATSRLSGSPPSARSAACWWEITEGTGASLVRVGSAGFYLDRVQRKLLSGCSVKTGQEYPIHFNGELWFYLITPYLTMPPLLLIFSGESAGSLKFFFTAQLMAWHHQLAFGLNGTDQIK